MTEELKVIISAEISKLKEGVQEAQSKIDELASSESKLSKLNDGFSKVGDAAKTGLKVAAGAVMGLTTAFLALGPATEEYRTAMAKLDTAFQSSGSNAETAKEVYNDLYRVLGETDVAVEAANHLAKLTTNEKDLAEWTDICQGVYATFGDSLPIEGLTEAANETAKTGELTGSLADALNWAGVSEDEFAAKLEACNTEAEREALIRQTLSGLYSDAAAGYEKNASAILKQNEAQAAMSEAMAKLGEVSQPIMTMLTQLGAEILTQLTPYIQDFAEKHLPKIQEALSGVGDKIGKVITWIADNWELISTIGTIILAIASAISVVSTVLGVYSAAMGVASTVSLPIIGIIAAIVAGLALLATGIVLAVKHWDEITAAVKNFATKVGEFFTGLWESITEWIGGIAESISTWWEETKEGFSQWWDGIKEGWSNFWTGVGEKVSNGAQKIKDKFQEMKENVSNKMNETKEKVSGKFEEIKNTMGTVMEAARATVDEKLSNIKQAYEKNGGGIKGTMAAAMEGVKGYFTSGLTFIDNLTNGKLSNIANVIKGKLNDAKNSVSTILENIKNKFSSIMENAKNIVSNAIEKIKGFFNFEWKLPKIKLPHFSISGKFSLDPPSIPKISVDWYAKGGVFDAPALFGYGNGQIGGLGENGAEAIVPLENNTQWLDKIAERLGARSNTPIVLQVDGKTFAQTSIDTINQLTAQTGSLALNIV